MSFIVAIVAEGRERIRKREGLPVGFLETLVLDNLLLHVKLIFGKSLVCSGLRRVCYILTCSSCYRLLEASSTFHHRFIDKFLDVSIFCHFSGRFCLIGCLTRRHVQCFVHTSILSRIFSFEHGSCNGVTIIIYGCCDWNRFSLSLLDRLCSGFSRAFTSWFWLLGPYLFNLENFKFLE